MLSLTQLNEQHKSDKGVAGKKYGGKNELEAHSYISHYYENKLLPLKEKTKTVVEIGVFTGSSMKLWHDYFLDAIIYGVDKKPRWNIDKEYNNRCKVITGNSDDISTYKEIPNDIDIVIDDGSHKLADQIKSFSILFPKLKKGGLYIIEDIVSIDEVKQSLLNLHSSAKIYDFRNITNRHDDVLVEIIK
jgi:trans-aconitate methyltransferase